MDRQPLIKLSRISGGYEGKIVLRNVNLEIYPNDFLGIIGPNGGGKTTLIKMILGLLKPASGDIAYSLQGKRTNEISIGYLPQYNTIDKKFPISVYEVVLSGLNKQSHCSARLQRNSTHRCNEPLPAWGCKDWRNAPSDS